MREICTYGSVVGPARQRVGLPDLDLVMPNDRMREIDVTRVQMLFFTLITAFFFAMKILVSSQIPEIPQGFLLLMGISNGVYLTAKFIPD